MGGSSHHDDGCDNGPKLDGIVEGTTKADLIDTAYKGDPDGDRIDANDAILPGEVGNDDIVKAGDGNDTVRAGEGNDEVYGERGDDKLYGQNGNDFLYGGEGRDTLDGGAGHDWLDSGADNDSLYGGSGNDTMFGGDGNDTLNGADGADTMSGGNDRDTFIIGIGDGINDLADGGAGGDDYDVLDLTGSAPPGGSYTVNIIGPDSNGNGYDGYVTYFDDKGAFAGTLTFTEIEEIKGYQPPCFTPGTLIATPTGERLAEELRAGDRIITRDNGIQTIRWVANTALDYAHLGRSPHLKPILIRKGSLGDDLPERDMLVSPNHRMLVANDRTALYFDEHEVLVAAKHLVDNKGVRQVDALGVTYLHFLFDQHEVVLANGAWSESFQPGDQSISGMGNAQRLELFELFPELRDRPARETFAAARRILKRHEASLLGR